MPGIHAEMNKIVGILPGLTGAICGYGLIKLISWTGLSFEFVSFLVTYLVVTVLMENAMQGYGKKL